MSLDLMRERLLHQGGASQHERLVRDKLRSMKAAIKSSYQAAHFNLYPDYPGTVEGLFNPVTQTMDYDTKLLSVPPEAGFRVGDVFLWEETQTHWICFAQDRTELSYFRGQCRRCDYKIKWVDEARQLQETYASIIGPNQPFKNTRSKNSAVTMDVANANLTIYVPDSPINNDYFKPYQKIILKGQAWEVTNIDDVSMPGVIEVYAVKSRANLIENDVEQDIHNAWNVQPVVPHYENEDMLVGPLTIKPLFEVEYYTPIPNGEWVILENLDGAKKRQILPVDFEEVNTLQQRIHVRWASPNSGSFTLGYREPGGKVLFQRHIIVESLM